MTFTPLRTDTQYAEAKARVADLIVRSDKASLEKLEIWTALIEQYERRRFEIDQPTPIAAIRFRMEHGGVTAKQLEPILGSRSRVSEILAGKRPLTLDMIRALHQHLGIPAASLIAPEKPEAVSKPQVPSSAALQKLRSLGCMKAKESFEQFLARAFGPQGAPALLRKTRTERTNAKTDQAALTGWLAAVKLIAENVDVQKPKKKVKAMDVARLVAKLSIHEDGPIRARAELAKLGIVLVILEHLPGTYLDGAALCRSDETRVIALTLRHDRLDNFWFTLLHELCHALNHLGAGTSLILDDLELKSSDAMEAEADQFAQNALIPLEIWEAEASPDWDGADVDRVARAAGVHTAIVAGRWQREHSDYRRFAKALGRGLVRSQNWGDAAA